MLKATRFVFWAIFLPSFCLAAIPDTPEIINENHTVYWSEDWEDGMGIWSASNGVWEVGIPCYGTSECIGNQCGATNLDGKYPYATNSRLESVWIDLPDSPKDNVLWLGFWHWFSNSASYGIDYGSVEICTEVDSVWVEKTHHFVRNGSIWAPFYLDISEYAGLAIRVGFHLRDVQDGSYAYQGPGWCVDQIRIFDGNFPTLNQINRLDQITDLDWEGWYPDQGVWELGAPVSGISQAHSRHDCFGTNLKGNYPYGTYSRLISPRVPLPESPLDNQLFFSFKQYCSLSGSYGVDQGAVQINDGTGWVTLYTCDWHNNLGGKWTEHTIDITEYIGEEVRIGFVIDDNQDGSYDYQSYGWYIDDLQFSEGAKYIGNPERFENFGPNWWTLRGLWEVGEPTTGPGTAWSPPNCWGTNLDGNYPYGALDYLNTPPITLDNTPGLTLRFKHWFSFSGQYGVDYGRVNIKPEGAEWVQLSPDFTGSSGGWTQYTHDLSIYAGQSIQIGFSIRDVQDGSYTRQSSGWYIDDFEIVGMPMAEAPVAPFELQVTISPDPAELVFPHTTVDIEKVVVYGSPVYDFKPTLGTRLAVLPPTAMIWDDIKRPGWPATYYRVSVVDILGNESVPIQAFWPQGYSSVETDRPQSSGGLMLTGAAPNPFNPSTYIHCNLPSSMMVDVEIFDIGGRKVVDLLHKTMDAGPNKVQFTAKGLASGTYFARVCAGDQTETKKIVLLK